MYYVKVFPDLSQILKFLIITCIVKTVSSTDCSSPSRNFTCNCDTTFLECTGIQTTASEIQAILANASSVSKIILKIAGLQFDPNFRFENMSITNLTLGYGLQTLPADLFGGPGSSLVSLNLQNNNIEDTDNELFFSLFNLTELFLDINSLHFLNSSMFANLLSLKYLSVTSNEIQVIKPDLFKNLTCLHTLLLSHNSIRILENVNIKSSSLYVLKVSDCLIQGVLENSTFSDLPNLRELDMSCNKLIGVKPNSLSSLKNLKFLNLSKNSIEYLLENAFGQLSNLISLDLKNNQIYLINRTSFANLLSLKYLDLSGNKLKAIFCDYTIDFPALEQIYLQDNEITTFTAGALFYSSNLKELNVTGNNLKCSCELTDVANYLIKNSAMESNDFNSVFCVVSSNRATVRVTEYDSSRCVQKEPCKKSTPRSSDDDYDYNNDETESDSDDIAGEKTGRITRAVDPSCSSLELFVGDSELTVAKNFSYDGTTFCLKWTSVGVLPPKSRCVIKYTYIKGTKSENLKCPTSSNEIQLWAKNEKIYKFCLNIYTDKKRDSCAKVSENETVAVRSTPVVTVAHTITELSEQPTTHSTAFPVTYTESTIHAYTDTTSRKTTFESTENADDLVTSKPDVSSTHVVTVDYAVPEISHQPITYSSTFSLIYRQSTTRAYAGTASRKTAVESKENKANSTTSLFDTPFVSFYHASTFEILSVALFNNSNFTYVEWYVNKEEPSDICNLTLTGSFQYSNNDEAVFSCKNNTYLLENVKEDEIFQICIQSHHKISGDGIKQCTYSLAGADFDSGASESRQNSNYNFSLIPLICVLVLLVLIVIISIIVTLYKKKHASERHSVSSDSIKQETPVTIQIRPPSSHENTSTRYSYTSMENPDIYEFPIVSSSF